MTRTAQDREIDDRLAQGDRTVLNEMFLRHRDRLTRMVQLRIDRPLRGRLDASDVVQDAYTEAANRLDDYLHTRPMPLFLWLRCLVSQRLAFLRRQHLGTAKRDAKREISLFHAPLAEASSDVLAASLVADLTSPSEAAIREEMRGEVQRAVEQMEPLDREIIALRHFEQLSRSETARVLQIRAAAASKRYLRALRRLRVILDGPDGIREAE